MYIATNKVITAKLWFLSSYKIKMFNFIAEKQTSRKRKRASDAETNGMWLATYAYMYV